MAHRVVPDRHLDRRPRREVGQLQGHQVGERPLKSVTTADEVRLLLASPLAVLFKHSTRCPVSAYAHREVSAFLERHPEAPVFLVDVIANRDLSRWIAAETGVTHESPQLLVVRNGAVTFTSSHDGVTADELERETL